MNIEQQRAAFESALSKKPEALYWNTSDAMFWAWQAATKCDGNHGGPRCADPECWNDSRAAIELYRQGRDEPVNDCALPSDDETLIGAGRCWRFGDLRAALRAEPVKVASEAEDDIVDLLAEYADYNAEHGRMSFDKWTLREAVSALLTRYGSKS